eukprot:scaffold449_cov184-Amphora_coffeaeformis.AAC.19
MKLSISWPRKSSVIAFPDKSPSVFMAQSCCGSQCSLESVSLLYNCSSSALQLQLDFRTLRQTNKQLGVGGGIIARSLSAVNW